MIAHEPRCLTRSAPDPGYDGAELRDKRVGMIGFGYLGRRSRGLLRTVRT